MKQGRFYIDQITSEFLAPKIAPVVLKDKLNDPSSFPTLATIRVSEKNVPTRSVCKNANPETILLKGSPPKIAPEKPTSPSPVVSFGSPEKSVDRFIPPSRFVRTDPHDNLPHSPAPHYKRNYPSDFSAGYPGFPRYPGYAHSTPSIFRWSHVGVR
jgi:hypothetical protein